MTHFLTKSLLIFIIFFIPVITSAQKKIKLTKTSTGKEVVIREGKRVVYFLEGQDKGSTGILNKIEDDSLLIDDKMIRLHDLTAFGKRKKGTGTWTFLMGAFGGACIGMGLAPASDPCPSCNQVNVDDSSETIERVAVIGVGAAFVTLAALKATNNSARDLKSDKWIIEVIE